MFQRHSLTCTLFVSVFDLNVFSIEQVVPNCVGHSDVLSKGCSTEVGGKFGSLVQTGWATGRPRG